MKPRHRHALPAALLSLLSLPPALAGDGYTLLPPGKAPLELQSAPVPARALPPCDGTATVSRVWVPAQGVVAEVELDPPASACTRSAPAMSGAGSATSSRP